MATTTIKSADGKGSFAAYVAEPKTKPADGLAVVVSAIRGHKHIATYVYLNADHAFARMNGIHWDDRSAAIANGRSAEALVAALG